MPVRAKKSKAAEPVTGRRLIESWFTARGWTPFGFQREAWDAFARGESGLIQVPTGAGKTYGAYLGPLASVIDEYLAAGRTPLEGIRILVVTPLRAVTRDAELALKAPIADLKVRLSVETRTGDTSAGVRAKQRSRLPNVLLTTPESLALLLSRDNARELFAPLRAVIVDEWHELIVSKRGSLLELGLARLRAFAPGVRTWGLSATLPNGHEALQALVGLPAPPMRVVRAPDERPIDIKLVVPSDLRRLPWAGHLGLNMLPDVLDLLDPAHATIVFANTRSQAERWYHAIQFERPEWAPVMALHHGSIDRDERERVEGGLKSGALRIVVATSSLDLGVDFSPVSRVVQIGSPKGVGRIVQRAGRSNHFAGGVSVIHCVPTHAMEIVEVRAAREAQRRGLLEARFPTPEPLDVLAQHLVTCAMGGGFDADAMYDEVRTAWSFRDLTRRSFDWTLELVREGGILRAYPQFQRVVRDDAGRYRVPSDRAKLLHRLNIGTITSEGALDIRLVSGRRLGVIDESFVTHLREGEKFVFAGRVLQFVGIHDLTVLVRPAAGSTRNTPLWAGTRLPISESLSAAIRDELERLAKMHDDEADEEAAAALPLVRTQQRLSEIPRSDQVLVEFARTREGSHLFLFPFEGRLANAGIAALVALRLSRLRPATFSLAANDYGFEVLCAENYPFEETLSKDLFSSENLADDAMASVSMSQLARLAFRDIARVAGLAPQNHPGARRTGKQMQASAGLIYDVLTEFDPENLLLAQARREVLEKHFESGRISRAMERIHGSEFILARPRALTPLSFPLVIEREAARLTSESIGERIARMQREWERWS
ncbi:MAG TPA: ligase-associated DNA damage response DEXH box helicase [Phycisphaerales bacterium]|nr:ligase-associated DNA damage response DEXH box helicase [Phycisphaerales bacterium]